MKTRHSKPGGHRSSWALALLASLGCGGATDEYQREPISGTITLDGQPLPAGVVTFEPAAGQPTQSGGMISSGSFSVRREQGPVPGRYSVSIFAGSPDPGLVASTEAAGPAPTSSGRSKLRDAVPERYNIKTELTAEVKAGEKNHFPFALESK